MRETSHRDSFRDEDGAFYAAIVDELLDGSYAVTFTEYGNTQITLEAKMRPSAALSIKQFEDHLSEQQRQAGTRSSSVPSHCSTLSLWQMPRRLPSGRLR